MSRLYTLSFDNVSVSAIQDLFGVYAGANRALAILAIQLGANGQTTVGNYRLRLRYLQQTVTVGSGGSTITVRPVDPNDAAAVFTARSNDPTQATSSGSYSIFADEFNPINGFYWQAPDPQRPPEVKPNEAATLSLDSITGTLNVNGTMWVVEL